MVKWGVRTDVLRCGHRHALVRRLCTQLHGQGSVQRGASLHFIRAGRIVTVPFFLAVGSWRFGHVILDHIIRAPAQRRGSVEIALLEFLRLVWRDQYRAVSRTLARITGCRQNGYSFPGLRDPLQR